MDKISISFPDDGAASRYAGVLEELKKVKTDNIDITEGTFKEIKVGPVILVPPDIIVAGIGALSAAIGAVLTFVATRKSGRIIIKGKSGRQIEVPKDTSLEEIDYYVEKAKEIDAGIIIVEKNKYQGK